MVERPTGKIHTTDALRIQILSNRTSLTTTWKRQNE
jgi:hypothetical protein